jgi:hypothetical protein
VGAEAAAARLVILGAPAVRNILKAFEDAPPAHRVRLIDVLERIGAPSALPVLANALTDEDEAVSVAAAAALGVLVSSANADVAATSLDHLATAALERGRSLAVRLAALRALGSGDDLDAVSLVRAQLLADPDPAVREAARQCTQDDEEDGAVTPPTPEASSPAQALAVVEAAAVGQLPPDPEHLRLAVAMAAEASLADLHRVIEHVRDRERQFPDDAPAWLTARAAVHQALAARDSRVAVYDLREALARLGGATPVGMLSALQQVGDVPALDVLADAWAAESDPWFRGQVEAAFQAIVGREGVTRRHAVIRRLAQRAPAALSSLWPSDASTPSRSRP